MLFEVCRAALQCMTVTNQSICVNEHDALRRSGFRRALIGGVGAAQRARLRAAGRAVVEIGVQARHAHRGRGEGAAEDERRGVGNGWLWMAHGHATEEKNSRRQDLLRVHAS